MKCACGAHHVAETAIVSISIFEFFNAGPFGSAIFVFNNN
jgi:hypothetical protein